MERDRGRQEVVYRGVPQVSQQLIPVPSGAMGIVPVSAGFSGAGVATGREGINIKIKNVAKAIVNEKSKRKSAADKGNKKLLARAKRKYNVLKRQTISAIKKGKAAHYKAESQKINSLPQAKRKSARASLRAELKKRHETLVAKLPTTTKMTLRDLARVTKIAQKLKW